MRARIRTFSAIPVSRKSNSLVVSQALTGARSPAPNPYTPPVESIAFDNTGQARNLGSVLTSLKECVDSLTGQQGDLTNRAVIFKDLVDFGILSPRAVSSPNGSVGGGGGGDVPGPEGPQGPTGPTGATGPAGPTGATGPQGPPGTGGGGGSVSTSDTAPVLPVDGDMWWDSVKGQLYIWYDDPSADAGQWVAATNMPGPAGPQGPPGATGSATGTLILNGVGPPADALGSPGNYYVDLSGQDMYGPKASAIAETITAPHVPGLTLAGTYRVGNDFQFVVAGQITAARFYRSSASVITSRQMFLYDNSSVLVGTTNASVAESGAGWVQLSFPSPISVTAGSTYTICYDCNADSFVYTDGAPPLTSAAHATWVTGRYGVTLSGRPGTVYAADYSADLVWQPLSGALWPLAVPGESGGTGGGISEAPSDGNAYGRQNAAWVDVLMSTGDIVDGGNY